jgi:hypothetical protein
MSATSIRNRSIIRTDSSRQSGQIRPDRQTDRQTDRYGGRNQRILNNVTALRVAVDNNLEFKIRKEGSYLQKNKKEPWRPKASKASISHNGRPLRHKKSIKKPPRIKD